MFLGLRSVIYPVSNLDQAKAWFSELLGAEPYFDQAFYVGFQAGGYELGLDPNLDPAAGPVTYWGVPDLDQALARLAAHGAHAETGIQNVGDGIRTAVVELPGGGTLGVIENPHFSLPIPSPSPDGPGR